MRDTVNISDYAKANALAARHFHLGYEQDHSYDLMRAKLGREYTKEAAAKLLLHHKNVWKMEEENVVQKV